MPNSECYPIDVVPGQSRLFLDYCAADPAVRPFYSSLPRETGWHQRCSRPDHWNEIVDLIAAQNPSSSAAPAIVGSSWLHHFGSVTLSLLKQERCLSQKQGLSGRDSYKLLGQSTLERKWKKFKRKQQERKWHDEELARYGMTLHGQREGGKFAWR